MEFIEAPAFSRHVHEYLDDERYRGLQGALAVNPNLGDVMQGAGGVPNMRWPDPRRGVARSSGISNTAALLSCTSRGLAAASPRYLATSISNLTSRSG